MCCPNHVSGYTHEVGIDTGKSMFKLYGSNWEHHSQKKKIDGNVCKHKRLHLMYIYYEKYIRLVSFIFLLKCPLSLVILS